MIRFHLFPLAVLASVSAASAQSPPPLVSEFTFVVTIDDTNQIERAIMELPKRVADPLLAKLAVQAQAQIAKAEAARKAQPDTKPDDGGKPKDDNK